MRVSPIKLLNDDMRNGVATKGSTCVNETSKRGRLNLHRFRAIDDTTRLTITIAQSTNAAIEALSEAMQLSKSAVANYILAKGLLIEAVQAKGGVIRCYMPDGEVLGLKETVDGGWAVLQTSEVETTSDVKNSYSES